MQKVAIVVPAGQPLSVKGKSWAKHLSRVDCTKANGFAFEGDWLQVGRKAEVPVGAYILAHSDTGSRSRPYSVVRLFRVQDDGTCEEVAKAEGPDWVLDLRDAAAALVNRTEGADKASAAAALAAFDDATLIAELERRGYLVIG